MSEPFSTQFIRIAICCCAFFAAASSLFNPRTLKTLAKFLQWAPFKQCFFLAQVFIIVVYLSIIIDASISLAVETGIPRQLNTVILYVSSKHLRPPPFCFVNV